MAGRARRPLGQARPPGRRLRPGTGNPGASCNPGSSRNPSVSSSDASDTRSERMTMEYVRGRKDGQPSAEGTGTFTGRAMLDPVLAEPGIRVNSVFFEPGARTHWHS